MTGGSWIAGRDAEHIARTDATPVFAHDLVSAREQALALRDAMAAAGLDFRIRFALKAQRDTGFLRFLRAEAPFVGMDVCSPGEVMWALEHGWAPERDQLHRDERVGRRPRARSCRPAST